MSDEQEAYLVGLGIGLFFGAIIAAYCVKTWGCG